MGGRKLGRVAEVSKTWGGGRVDKRRENWGLGIDMMLDMW